MKNKAKENKFTKRFSSSKTTFSSPLPRQPSENVVFSSNNLSHAPKKSLGQNFLTSVGALNKIILAGNVTEKSTILEIGPGRGALTKKLLETGATVYAIEKDRDLIPYLTELFASYIAQKKFILIEGDVLECLPQFFSQANFSRPVPTPPLSKLLVSKNVEKSTMKKYSVIANIPYYITGEIIRLFLENKHKPEVLVFLVQKEVAERIVSKDGKESILSLSVKAYGTPKYIATVSRGSFFPSPNVDSAIIQIILDQNNFKNKKAEETFFTVIKTGFKAKRKKALSNLASLGTKENIEHIFQNLGLDANIRPEAISCTQWIQISTQI